MGSIWFDAVRGVYESFEMAGGDVGVLRRVVEMYGSRTKMIATKGDDEVRRTIGSRARTRF